MESFYDAPRNSPQPTSSDHIFTNFLVPDVSIVAQQGPKEKQLTQQKHMPTYNMWKKQNEQFSNNVGNISNENKENGQFASNPMISLSRKQVRFQALNENDDSLYMFGQKYINNTQKPHIEANKSANPYNENKPFENIYMANIPSLQLDLSLIDNNKQVLHNMQKKPIDNVLQPIPENFNKKQVEPTGEVFNTPLLKKYFTNRKDNTTIPATTSYSELDNNTATFQDFKQKRQAKKNAANLNYSTIDDPTRSNQYNKTSYDVGVSKLNSYNTTSSFERHSERSYQVNTASNFNYRNNTPPSSDRYNEENYQSRRRNSEISTYIERDSGDSTVRDLLKIIQQQNEQILILQKQVAGLLESKENDYRKIEMMEKEYKQLENRQQNFKRLEIENGKLIENPETENNKSDEAERDVKNANYTYKNTQMSNAENNANKQPCTNILEAIDTTPFNRNKADYLLDPSKHPKNVLNKFAIDVMTSFEVSIRPQAFKNAPTDYKNEAKIREIVENDQQLSKNDVSMVFNEPIPVQEKCPSPVNSIHVDMKDFSSDEDDPDSSDIGWTIYNNVMGQVNNILKKASPNSEKQKVQYETLKTVKAATLGHLKNIGVDVSPDSENSSIQNSNAENSFDSNEISFVVKQLLLKYLPSEHLMKMTASKPNIEHKLSKKLSKNPKFSFATVQYMKKYNLLAGEETTPEEIKQTPAVNRQIENKLLDITTLKNQPKLL